MSLISKIVQFLSGDVPGGIMSLIFILFLYNLNMLLMGKYSGLMNWEKVRSRMISVSLFLIALYMVIWYAVMPPVLQPRIIFFPTISSQPGERMKLPFAIDKNLKKEIQKDHTYHPAEWIVNSANLDSLFLKDYQRQLAERMDAAWWLISSEDGGKWRWELYSESSLKPVVFGISNDLDSTYALMVAALSENLDLEFQEMSKSRTLPIYPGNTMEIYWWDLVDSVNKVLNIYEYSDSVFQNNELALTSYANAIILKAFELKTKQDNIKNPYRKNSHYVNWFRRGRNKLVEMGKNDPANLKINLILANSYILVENYDLAEIALKNAYVSDPYSAEVYYLFSFLDPSRYADLNLSNLKELLEKSLALNPIYQDAMVKYIRRVGEESVSDKRMLYNMAVDRAREYLRINPSSYIIQNELAGILFTGNHFEEALVAINKALEINPEDEGVIFNAGIIYYRLKRLDDALPFFDQAISRYNNLESHLYRGMIHMKQERYKEAVLDFRYRIVHKISDDDFYYLQAAKGLRQVIEKLNERGINVDDLVPPEHLN